MAVSIIRWLKDYSIDLLEAGSTTADNTAISYRICQDLKLKQADLFDLCLVLELLKVGDVSRFLELSGPYLDLIRCLIPTLSQNRSLTRAESAWLAWQLAYLKGFRDILLQEQWLNRLWIKRGQIQRKNAHDYDALHDGLLNLKQYEFGDEEAEEALSIVERSGLIKRLDEIAIAWLMTYGAEAKQAQLIIRRLNHGLWGYLLEVVLQNPLSLVQLQPFVGINQSLNKQNQDGRINHELEQYRANLVKSQIEPFRGEYFALPDLYVKPSALPVVDQTENPYELHDWGRAQLELPHSISLIEGPSGSGKTAFCKIFAAYVSRFLYPEWMPVVINLQQLHLGKNFIDSLESLKEELPALQQWLTGGQMRIVLLLDGINNLPPLSNNYRHPALVLFNQIIQFLEDSFLEHKAQKYKIMVTGDRFQSLFKPHELQNLNRQPSRHSSLPMLMATHTVTLLPFDKSQIRTWFQKWLLIQSKPISQAFFQFLKSQRLFNWDHEDEPVLKFINRPGIMYLLALLYRDGLVKPDLFKCSLAQMQFQFYELLWQWLLSRPDSPHQLPEIVKDGMGHSYRTKAIASTLVEDRDPEELITQWTQLNLELLRGTKITSSDHTLHPLLYQEANYHLQFSYGSGSITFANNHLLHPSVAHHLSQRLQTLETLDFEEQGRLIYQIFGMILEVEVLELMVEHLQRWAKSRRHQSFFKDLYSSLKRLYDLYCDDYWLFQWENRGSPAQRIAQERAVGINLFILIALLGKLLTSPFHPCGMVGQNFNRDRFKTFLNKVKFPYSPGLYHDLRPYLQHINLVGASLDGLNLSGVTLTKSNLAFSSFTETNLQGAHLAKASLPWSNFTYSNLKGTNLREINAEGTDFSYADLTDADLSQAYLKNCCFYQTILNPTQQQILAGKPVFFDRKGFDLYNQDLLRQNHKTYALNVTLTEHGDPIDIDIESAEGDLLPSWAMGDNAPILEESSETLITQIRPGTPEEPSPFFVLDQLQDHQTHHDEEGIATIIIDD